MRGSATSTASPAPPAALGGCTRRRTPWGGGGVLDGLAFTPTARTGAKTSSCALVQPLPTSAEVITALAGLLWSLPLVRLPTTEVVASAGETVSATCCRSFGSLALMASLLPPMGGRG
jgi:hypothetical protein